MKDLQVAVSKLMAANIYSEYREGDVRVIFGGVGFSDASGVKVYRKGFNIIFADGAWFVRLPGEGQMVEEVKVGSLDDAIAKVIAFYD